MFLIRSYILYIVQLSSHFYSISWSTVSSGWCGATPLCCPLGMTDFIVISDILLCEFVMLAKNNIKIIKS